MSRKKTLAALVALMAVVALTAVAWYTRRRSLR
jgi:hypothetical protein